MMEYEIPIEKGAAPVVMVESTKPLTTRRDEIDSGIPWVEKYRPQRYVLPL